MLLRRVIGDVLRARRQGQHRTLREVSTAANVSLGYLSEIERGQKEASSELLAAICGALGSQLSEVLRAASDSLALVERTDAVLTEAALDTALAGAALADTARGEATVTDATLTDATLTDAALTDAALTDAALADSTPPARSEPVPVNGVPVPLNGVPVNGADAPRHPVPAGAQARTVTDGTVSVCVRRNGPLRTTLYSVRNRRPGISRAAELTRPAG